MNIIKVSNRQEFERALKDRVRKIIYEGPDAVRILNQIAKEEKKKASSRRNAGLAIGLGVLALIAAPFTGGTSLLGLGATGAVAATAGAVALSEGVTLAIIAAVTTISVEAIQALKGYKIEKCQSGIIATLK